MAVEMAMLLRSRRRVALALGFRHAETGTILGRRLFLPGTSLALAVLSEINDISHACCLVPAAVHRPVSRTFCRSGQGEAWSCDFGPRWMVLALGFCVSASLEGGTIGWG